MTLYVNYLQRQIYALQAASSNIDEPDKPEVPAVPLAQDIVNALLALGLITQADNG